MYTEFFGLEEAPFTLTPNPHFTFHSQQYRATLDQILFGLDRKEGFLLLTGPVGTGKTTLCRELLDELPESRFRTALVFNPFLDARELLQTLLTEFGCSYTPEMGRKDLLDRLNIYLLSQLVAGHTCVAIFDEAQHLSLEFLEQIRVLSNLETSSEKLLQIILVGQPELRARIEQPGLAQLDQRVSIRVTLASLDRDETERFIYHRLDLAGANGHVRFDRRAMDLIHAQSQGIPRLINQICDRALLAGFVDRTRSIGVRQVRQALDALRGSDSRQREPARLSGSGRRRLGALIAAAGITMVVFAGAALLWWRGLLP